MDNDCDLCSLIAPLANFFKTTVLSCKSLYPFSLMFYMFTLIENTCLCTLVQVLEVILIEKSLNISALSRAYSHMVTKYIIKLDRSDSNKREKV